MGDGGTYNQSFILLVMKSSMMLPRITLLPARNYAQLGAATHRLIILPAGEGMRDVARDAAYVAQVNGVRHDRVTLSGYASANF
jgi:hypothetical protein